MEDLKSFLQQSKETSREEFLGENSHPLLVAGLREKKEKKEESFDGSDTAHIEEDIVEAVVEKTWIKPGWVIPLKDKENLNSISLGSSPEATITIPLPNLSEIHGTFHLSKTGAMKYVDSESDRGTYYNGEKLSPGAHIEIESGDTLAFGPHLLFQYYEPGHLYEIISDLNS